MSRSTLINSIILNISCYLCNKCRGAAGRTFRRGRRPWCNVWQSMSFPRRNMASGSSLLKKFFILMWKNLLGKVRKMKKDSQILHSVIYSFHFISVRKEFRISSKRKIKHFDNLNLIVKKNEWSRIAWKAWFEKKNLTFYWITFNHFILSLDIINLIYIYNFYWAWGS